MIPTFFTTLALGIITNTVATITALSTFIAGSAIMQGNLFFDTTNNANPGIYVNTVKVLSFTGSSTAASGFSFDSTNSQAACLKYGATATDCYQQQVFTAGTGACVAAGCTGASGKSYHAVSITKPYSGSGVIKRVEVTCDGHNPSTTLYAAQVATASTVSGNNILGIKTVSSGSLVVSSTGGLLWAEATPDIRVFLGKKSTNSQCLFRVWSDEMYNP